MQITYSNIVAGDTIQLPIRDITSAISITWGDGSATQTGITANNPSKTYSVTRATITIDVSAVGSFSTFGGSQTILSNIGKMTQLNRWGTYNYGITNVSYAFYFATGLTSIPNSIPSTVTNMEGMFRAASICNDSNILLWDVSNVINMKAMFREGQSFNQPF